MVIATVNGTVWSAHLFEKQITGPEEMEPLKDCIAGEIDYAVKF